MDSEDSSPKPTQVTLGNNAAIEKDLSLNSMLHSPLGGTYSHRAVSRQQRGTSKGVIWALPTQGAIDTSVFLYLDIAVIISFLVF